MKEMLEGLPNLFCEDDHDSSIEELNNECCETKETEISSDVVKCSGTSENKSKRVKSRLVRQTFRINEVSGLPIQPQLSQHISRVHFPFLNKDITPDLLTTISHHLHFIPLNLVDIAFRDPVDNHPIILQLYPLNISEIYGTDKPQDPTDREIRLPFPTMYWISDPHVFDQVASLEQQGWINILQEKLLGCEESLAIMKIAHEQYSKDRLNLLSYEDKVFVENKGWYVWLFLFLVSCLLISTFYFTGFELLGKLVLLESATFVK
jgi:hypothetical protein